MYKLFYKAVTTALICSFIAPNLVAEEFVDPLLASPTQELLEANSNVGIYSCPENSSYHSEFDATTMKYIERCAPDLASVSTDLNEDEIEDNYQTTHINAMITGTQEREKYRVAGVLSLSPDNPFIAQKETLDAALEEFKNSDNPLIRDLRETYGGTINESLLLQIKSDAQIQQSILRKLEGTHLKSEFENFLHR